MFLKPGEYKARILRPIFFHEEKDKALIPKVCHSWMFHDSIEEARIASAEMIRQSFLNRLHKYGEQYTPEQVDEAISRIEVLTL